MDIKRPPGYRYLSEIVFELRRTCPNYWQKKKFYQYTVTSRVHGQQPLSILQVIETIRLSIYSVLIPEITCRHPRYRGPTLLVWQKAWPNKLFFFSQYFDIYLISRIQNIYSSELLRFLRPQPAFYDCPFFSKFWDSIRKQYSVCSPLGDPTTTCWGCQIYELWLYKYFWLIEWI